MLTIFLFLLRIVGTKLNGFLKKYYTGIVGVKLNGLKFLF